jgi:DNA-binding protein H-NS
VRSGERAEALATVHALIVEFNLDKGDVFPAVKVRTSDNKGKSKVPAKYRDPVSGAEWSGRGVAPLWAKNDKKDYTKFLIA